MSTNPVRADGKPVLDPGPNHPITLEPSPARIRVTVAGKVIADTSAALIMRETTYPPVYYIPRQDADMSQLARTDNYSY